MLDDTAYIDNKPCSLRKIIVSSFAHLGAAQLVLDSPPRTVPQQTPTTSAVAYPLVPDIALTTHHRQRALPLPSPTTTTKLLLLTPLLLLTDHLQNTYHAYLFHLRTTSPPSSPHPPPTHTLLPPPLSPGTSQLSLSPLPPWPPVANTPPHPP